VKSWEVLANLLYRVKVHYLVLLSCSNCVPITLQVTREEPLFPRSLHNFYSLTAVLAVDEFVVIKLTSSCDSCHKYSWGK